MKRFLTLLCIVGFGCCLWNCSPVQSYSEIPEIHFKGLTFEDRIDPDLEIIIPSAILTFSFIDGDGDLGVRPIDALYEETRISKIYYTWYQKMPDRTYVPYQFENGETISSDIPYDEVMNKENAQNKVLKGTIQIGLDMPSQTQDIDTMRIGFYITDRARHQSNIEYTPDFSILTTSGTIQ